MAQLPPYTSTGERIWHYTFRFICGLIFLFLILPVLIVLPLSFNVEPYFSFTPGMLTFDAEAFSLRWYKDIFRNGMQAPALALNAKTDRGHAGLVHCPARANGLMQHCSTPGVRTLQDTHQ